MLHELGHTFARLGDEYDEYPTGEERAIQTEGKPNLDSISDLTKIKWKHFIGLEDYQSVRAFEGGQYNSKGVWRPEESSIMRETWGNYPYFNAPSREAIVKRILELNGLPYSFEEFILKDKIALDTINSKLESSKKILESFQCGYSQN